MSPEALSSAALVKALRMRKLAKKNKEKGACTSCFLLFYLFEIVFQMKISYFACDVPVPVPMLGLRL